MRKRVFIAAIVAIVVAPCAYLAYTISSAPIGSDPATTCWIATGVGDVDGDGSGDLALTLRFDPGTEADLFTTWILSGREGKPLYTIRIDPALVDWGQTPEFGTSPPAWHAVHRLSDLDRDGCSELGVSCVIATQTRDRSNTIVLSGKDGRILLDNLPSSDNWGAGPNFETLGEVNGDGTPDLLVTIAGDNRHGVPNRVSILSGADGSEIRRVESTPRPSGLKGFPNAIAPTRFGRDLCVVGDVDSDDIADFVVSDPNIYLNETAWPSIFCFAGGTGRLLWTIESTYRKTKGWEIDALGDFDSDGISEVLVSVYPSDHVIVSGRDGAVLPIDRSLRGVGSVDDIDRDGIVDLWKNSGKRGQSSAAAPPTIEITSGRTGEPFFTCWLDARAEFVGACRSAGDINGDGTPDIALTGDVAMEFEGRRWKPAFGVVSIHSGKDGSLLRTYDREYLRELSKGDVPSVVIR